MVNSWPVKVFGFVLCALLLAWSIPVEAQQQKTFRIGELVFRDRSALGAGRSAFRQQLLKLGYIEGKNVSYETRSAKGELDRYQALAEELVRSSVDVLVASSVNETIAFKNATKTIPIVFVMPNDPVAHGLIDSMARPGGNITGFTFVAPVLAGKRLEILKETFPKISRVAVLWNPQDLSTTEQWKDSQVPASGLRLQLHSIEVSSPEKYESAFRELIKRRTDGIVVTGGALNTAHSQLIADLVKKSRLPAIFDRQEFVMVGGMMSYGPDRSEFYRRAAVFVDKILKGAKPADLPVEQPTKFELVINLKTAKQIGLTIPPNVLGRADRVIR
jgi:putative ABC transport system substrate-binding protein